MTLGELSQLYWLKKEIEMDEERLKALESRAYSPSGSVAGGNPTGEVSQRTERYAVEIAEIKTIIEDKRRRCIEEKQKLERYITGIEDSLTRQIYTLRFVNGESWEKIAMELGGGNTTDGVRKRVYRYMKTHD